MRMTRLTWREMMRLECRTSWPLPLCHGEGENLGTGRICRAELAEEMRGCQWWCERRLHDGVGRNFGIATGLPGWFGEKFQGIGGGVNAASTLETGEDLGSGGLAWLDAANLLWFRKWC